MTHVLVLAGGLSHERDVSLRSGRRVADALARGGCETHVRDVDSTLLGRHQRDPSGRGLAGAARRHGRGRRAA